MLGVGLGLTVCTVKSSPVPSFPIEFVVSVPLEVLTDDGVAPEMSVGWAKVNVGVGVTALLHYCCVTGSGECW